MSRHGIAILGAGMIGAAHASGYRAHLPRFSRQLDGLRLLAIADPQRDLASKLAETYGFERTVDDWKAVIDDPEVGIVSVALPNFLHVEAVEAALGVPRSLAS